MIVKTVAEMWPEHEGHDVRYSEFGRTDYRLVSVALDELDPIKPGAPREFVVQCDEHDVAPIDGRIDETSLWCADCGERFGDWVTEEA